MCKFEGNLFVQFGDWVDCNDASHLQNTLLAVAGDDEHVQVYDLTTEKCICEFKAHENRWVLLTEWCDEAALDI